MAGKNQKKKIHTVSLSLPAEQIQGKSPVLLLTASQIDEVLADVEIQMLPFAAEYLLGLCAWRENVLPIIDLVSFFGMIPTQKKEDARYVVVRTVDKNKKDVRMILRCVLKVSDHIISGESPTDCKAVLPKQAGLQAGFAPIFVRGLFQREKELFILPDIAAILHSNST
ncbi:Chemotaxis signal transduction protein [Candidatus Electrothrix gigas]